MGGGCLRNDLYRKRKPSQEVSREISRVERDNHRTQQNQYDTELVRHVFDQLDKKPIREQLIREQHGLCAYCMRRIHADNSSVIEHWMPVDFNGACALEYRNMMLCCDGGRTENKKPKVLCCDASKGNTVIQINPYNRQQMEKIRYDKNGRIYIYPEDSNLQADIDDVLHLNGKVSAIGKTQEDTATGLVYGRRMAFRGYETYIKGLAKKNKSIYKSVKKKIEEIQNADEYVEFAGVWLYFLKRKLKRGSGN